MQVSWVVIAFWQRKLMKTTTLWPPITFSVSESDHLFGLGWGLLSRFPPFRYFPNFATSPKYTLYIQLLNITFIFDTCKIWVRFKECNGYFCDIENFAYGEIDERSFSNSHPRRIVASHGAVYPVNSISWFLMTWLAWQRKGPQHRQYLTYLKKEKNIKNHWSTIHELIITACTLITLMIHFWQIMDTVGTGLEWFPKPNPRSWL